MQKVLAPSSQDIDSRAYYSTPDGTAITDPDNHGKEIEEYFREEIMMLRQLLEGKDVLECGFGTGRVLLGLGDDVRRIDGVDINRDLVCCFREKFGRTFRKGRVFQGDFATFPLPKYRKGEKYDAALFAFNTLGNYPDPREIIEHVRTLARSVCISFWKAGGRSRLARDEFYQQCESGEYNPGELLCGGVCRTDKGFYSRDFNQRELKAFAQKYHLFMRQIIPARLFLLLNADLEPEPGFSYIPFDEYGDPELPVT